MRPAARSILTAVRRRTTESGDALERGVLAPCAAILQSLAAPPACPQRCLTSAASTHYSDSGPGPAVAPGQPAAAGAASGAATRKPRTKAEQLSPGMEDFVKQLFAADLDALPADEGGEAQQPEPVGGAEQPAAPAAEPQQPAVAAAAADSAALDATAAALSNTAAPSMDPATAKRREKRIKRLLGDGARGKDYEAWLVANAEGVAAFRASAAATLAEHGRRNFTARQAVVVEDLLVWLFRTKRALLLQPSQHDPAKLLAQCGLEDAIDLLRQLGIRGGLVPGVLARCPSLLGRLPTPEGLEALQELFGGRDALGSAAVRSPSMLKMDVSKVKRRLEVLALLLHRSEREVAAIAAQHPSLLGCGEEVLAGSARFLGSLLPLRPYNTLVQRFPYLLSVPLERRLQSLQRRLARDAPELAAIDLQLLVSQQPTLLLKHPTDVAAQWQLLRQAAAAVPAWQMELEAIAAPMSQEAAGGSAAADRGSRQEQQELSEADQWLADMLASLPGGGSSSSEHLASEAPVVSTSGWASEAASSSSSVEAASSVQAGSDGERAATAEGEAAPAWFHRDEAGEAAAVIPGAFGTQQRPWADSDRLRLRQLARLLDARRWQLLRLVFLGETAGEAAGRHSLLGVVMAHLSAFERSHPDFPAWLENQLRREEEERLRAEEERLQRVAERAAQRAAARDQAAREAAAGEAGVSASWDPAAAAAAAEPTGLEAADVLYEAADLAPGTAAASAPSVQEQAGAGDMPPAAGAPQQQ